MYLYSNKSLTSPFMPSKIIRWGVQIGHTNCGKLTQHEVLTEKRIVCTVLCCSSRKPDLLSATALSPLNLLNANGSQYSFAPMYCLVLLYFQICVLFVLFPCGIIDIQHYTYLTFRIRLSHEEWDTCESQPQFYFLLALWLLPSSSSSLKQFRIIITSIS